MKRRMQYAVAILGHASKFAVIRLQILRCKHSTLGNLHFDVLRPGNLVLVTKHVLSFFRTCA